MDSKSIGIEGWAADHRQNLASTRIHGNYCTVLVPERFFGCNLQIDINGELELLARFCRLLFQRLADFPPMTVDQHLPRAVLAHQKIVVFEFYPGLADNVPRVV